MNDQSPIDPLDRMLRDHLSDEAPEAVQARAEHEFHAARCEFRRRRMKHSLWSRLHAAPARLVLASAGVAAGLAVAVVSVLLLIPARVTWADVVKKFGSVPYFNATIFLTEGPQKETERIELWVASDQRIRVQQRGHVFFGKAGKVLKVYDCSGTSGEEIPLDRLTPDQKHGVELPLSMIKMMGKMEQFSLDGFLALINNGHMIKSPPLKNADASVAANMIVFDVMSADSPEWMRIWVLKDSGLPVRLRDSNPSNGDSLEVVFDYLKEQPAEAFDPVAFQKAMRPLPGESNKAHALLQDPGGQPVTPLDIFKKNGYHMPELVEAGRTEGGVLWVRSRNAVNSTPQNGRFYGYGMLEDDLGQEYTRKWVGQKADGNEVLEYFVPLNYRQDYRPPKSYTLTCLPHFDERRRQPGDVVGVVNLKEWKEGAAVPVFFENTKAPAESDFLRAAIDALRSRSNWDAVGKLLALIPGEPETSDDALYRESARLDMLQATNRPDDAIKLAARLYPIVKDRLCEPTYWQAYRTVLNYIEILVRAGKKDEARAVCEYEIPRLREQKIGPNGDLYAWFVSNLWMELRRPGFTSRGTDDSTIYSFAGLSSEAFAEVIGFDVAKDSRVMERLKLLGLAKALRQTPTAGGPGSSQ
jgi:hypothetical protein